MDNEAAGKYLNKQDDQFWYVAPVILLTPHATWTTRESLKGAIGPSLLESTWERISRGRVIGGSPPPQYRPLPESQHPGLSTAAFDALRAKFGRS